MRFEFIGIPTKIDIVVTHISLPAPEDGRLVRIEQQTKAILMKVSELSAALDKVSTQVDKVISEIETLKTSLTDVELPPEAQASLDRLSAAAQSADDEIPDMPAGGTEQPPVP